MTGVEDLRAGLVRGVKLLTTQQRIGLRHHEEFQLRMPREEAVAIGRGLHSSTYQFNLSRV